MVKITKQQSMDCLKVHGYKVSKTYNTISLYTGDEITRYARLSIEGTNTLVVITMCTSLENEAQIKKFQSELKYCMELMNEIKRIENI